MPQRNTPSAPRSSPAESYGTRRAQRLGSATVGATLKSVSFGDAPPRGFVALAVVTAAIGLKGHVRVKPLASARRVGGQADSGASPAWVELLKQVWLRSASGWRLSKVLSCNARGNDFCIELTCSGCRDEAQSLIGTRLGTTRDNPIFARQSGADDTLLWSDLIGRKVENTQGDVLGEITRLETNGHHDWLVVGDLFIPLVEKHVISMGDATAPVVVDWEKDWS